MGREEVVIWAGRGMLKYAGKPTCRKAAPSKMDNMMKSVHCPYTWSLNRVRVTKNRFFF